MTEVHPLTCSKEPPSASAGGVVLTRVTDESRLDPRAPPEDDDPTLRKVRRAADMLGYDPLPVDNAQVGRTGPVRLVPEVQNLKILLAVRKYFLSTKDDFKNVTINF